MAVPYASFNLRFRHTNFAASRPLEAAFDQKLSVGSRSDCLVRAINHLIDRLSHPAT
jgi:hypothetical protein